VEALDALRQWVDLLVIFPAQLRDTRWTYGLQEVAAETGYTQSVAGEKLGLSRAPFNIGKVKPGRYR